MFKKLRPVLGIALLLGIGALALGRDEVTNPHWLSDSEIQTIVRNDAAPPATNSSADQADFLAVLAAQNSRTPAQCQEAEIDADYSMDLFSDGMGSSVTRENDPTTFGFLERCNRQIGEIVTDMKNRWQRLRPYQSHPEIHPLFQGGGYSYPSGHSTNSFATALVLGQLFPAKADAFIARAHLIAQSRVDAGVHYPTDIMDGEVEGREIAKEFLANPEFMTELNAAKAELASKK